jgi:5S rRNA maturation endonuclease (ribonuclease M5)
MMNTSRNIPSAIDVERAARLRELIEALHEINKTAPIIVEGKKDASALRVLGLEGQIITLHNGKKLYEFCAEITERFERVILLSDWDKKGENLNKILSDNLKGLWEEFSPFREILKLLCQKEICHVEGIPKLLRRLEGNEGSWQ